MVAAMENSDVGTIPGYEQKNPLSVRCVHLEYTRFIQKVGGHQRGSEVPPASLENVCTGAVKSSGD